jgi:hypothetical protein
VGATSTQVAIWLAGKEACCRHLAGASVTAAMPHHSSAMPGSGVPPSSESSASFLQAGRQAGEQGACVLAASG